MSRKPIKEFDIWTCSCDGKKRPLMGLMQHLREAHHVDPAKERFQRVMFFHLDGRDFSESKYEYRGTECATLFQRHVRSKRDNHEGGE